MTEMDSPLDRDDHHHSASEETPLIAAVESTLPALDDADPRETYRWPVLIICFAIAFNIDLAAAIFNPSINALLEERICSEAYPDIANLLVPGQDNPSCKDPAVQGTLAMYRGWTFALEALPTIFLTIPYGSLSDKLGRKLVLALSLAGIYLNILWYDIFFYFNLPMWTYPLSFVWLILGGGSPVAISMACTMIADVVHVDQMASVLSLFYSVLLSGELIGTPLGGILLSKSPWIALMTANVFMAIGLCVLCALPETLVVRRWHDRKNGRQSSSRPRAAESGDNTKRSLLQSVSDTARYHILRIREFVLVNKRLVVLLVPFICVSPTKYISELLLQYSTKRFGWTWSKAAYFMTLKSASYIIMLTILLPGLSSLCQRVLKMSPLSKDLWLARWSSVLLVLADIMLALSFTPGLYSAGIIIFSSGSGFSPLLRSLLNALVEPHHVGILNSLIGLLETTGVMVCAPIFSAALQKGINLGGAWIGLPFAVAASVVLCGVAVLFLYHIPQDFERDIVEEDHLS